MPELVKYTNIISLTNKCVEFFTVDADGFCSQNIADSPTFRAESNKIFAYSYNKFLMEFYGRILYYISSPHTNFKLLKHPVTEYAYSKWIDFNHCLNYPNTIKYNEKILPDISKYQTYIYESTYTISDENGLFLKSILDFSDPFLDNMENLISKQQIYFFAYLDSFYSAWNIFSDYIALPKICENKFTEEDSEKINLPSRKFFLFDSMQIELVITFPQKMWSKEQLNLILIKINELALDKLALRCGFHEGNILDAGRFSSFFEEENMSIVNFYFDIKSYERNANSKEYNLILRSGDNNGTH